MTDTSAGGEVRARHRPPSTPEALKARLTHPAAGALATFEGWVRNHADGRGVRLLEYQAYPELAQAEGERVVAEALRRFDVISRALRTSFRYTAHRRYSGVGRRGRRAPRRGV